jgi:hypothetical protein
MNPPSKLTGSHLRTYNTIFQHPVSHNLEWRAVRSLLENLGHVAEEPNGNLKATRNGQSVVLHPPRTKDVAEIDDLMALRHFIERSEEAAQPQMSGSPVDWLLLIDHHEARIYRLEIAGAVPQQILPHEPGENFRHAHNAKDFTRGREKPEPNSFFEPVATALKTAGRILVFGSGTGTSSEMDQFIAWLKVHHADLAKRVIGTAVVDGHHLTEDQLLSKAREFFAAPLKSQV